MKNKKLFLIPLVMSTEAANAAISNDAVKTALSNYCVPYSETAPSNNGYYQKYNKPVCGSVFEANYNPAKSNPKCDCSTNPNASHKTTYTDAGNYLIYDATTRRCEPTCPNRHKIKELTGCPTGTFQDKINKNTSKTPKYLACEKCTYPTNATWAADTGCDWKCNSGFTQIGSSLCCQNLPTNASWNSGASNCNAWSCNNSYTKIGSNCCQLPSGATWNSGASNCDAWSCSPGYSKGGSSCNICPAGTYSSNGLSCNACLFKSNKNKENVHLDISTEKTYYSSPGKASCSNTWTEVKNWTSPGSYSISLSSGVYLFYVEAGGGGGGASKTGYWGYVGGSGGAIRVIEYINNTTSYDVTVGSGGSGGSRSLGSAKAGKDGKDSCIGSYCATGGKGGCGGCCGGLDCLKYADDGWCKNTSNSTAYCYYGGMGGGIVMMAAGKDGRNGSVKIYKLNE